MTNKALVLIGTNDVGGLRRFRDAQWTWPGGMLWVNSSGRIYLSSPRKVVGRLPQPLRAADFLGWLRQEKITIDKVYQEPETIFQLDVQRLWQVQEDAMIQGILTLLLKK